MLCGRWRAVPSDAWVLRYAWDTEEQQEVLRTLVQDSIEQAEGDSDDARHPRSRGSESPDAESLADIAIQSAESAQAFGIPPRVALISYSTGQSGSGADVEKVREATRIAREARPDLLLDGPLQYDAAAVADVARTKAPDSLVAGNATVFIFPDLNTGNTTYKAVQRSANLISIGPMLQGLKKPVNDLSRGALVDDIVYTIAITAVQADI